MQLPTRNPLFDVMQKKFKKKFAVKKEIRGKTSSEPSQIGSTKISIQQRNWQLLIIVALAILTFIAYQPALDNQFVDWDDYAYVVDNDLVRQQNRPTDIKDIFLRPVSLNYHPVTILTMRWNDNVCAECPNGISAKPFIGWNIFITYFKCHYGFLPGISFEPAKLVRSYFLRNGVCPSPHACRVSCMGLRTKRCALCFLLPCRVAFL